MKTHTFIYILVLPVLIFACKPKPVVESKQNWKGTVVSSETNCKNIGKDILGDYDLTVSLGEADTVLLKVVKSGNIFKGVRSVKDSSLYMFTASFREDAGIVTERMQIHITEPGKGVGSSVWAWTDGLMSCTGSFEFTVEKIKQ